jgi:hypothetical protein
MHECTSGVPRSHDRLFNHGIPASPEAIPLNTWNPPIQFSVTVDDSFVGSATKIKEWCCEKSIKWQFCTHTAAHHNGCAEALVRTCKTALKHAIGEQILSALELQTVLFEVANLVN